MLIGYARVSTADQYLSMQEDALKSAGCEDIFTDVVSGVKTARPGLHSALSHLRKDDMLVVWRLDRLGRSLAHLIQTIKELSEKGIGFKSLQENIDTTTSGGQWKLLQACIDKELNGQSEIHYTNVFRQFQRWCNDGSLDQLFEQSVMRLKVRKMLDTSVLHGDGTTTPAKKGGDNIGYSGHKHFKGEKVIAITDRNGNVLSPYTTAPGNKNEAPLFKPALDHLKKITKAIGINILGSIMSLDGVYDSRKNRKLIFNAGMKPNIPENKRNRKKAKRGKKRRFDPVIFEERFFTIERMFSWEDKFKRALIRFEKISQHYLGVKRIAYSMINLRHFCH